MWMFVLGMAQAKTVVLPDLFVDALVYAPNRNGNSYLYVTVMNDGTASSGEFNVSIRRGYSGEYGSWLEHSTGLTACDDWFCSRSFVIDLGRTDAQPSAPSATWFEIYVDSDSQVAESNELDNTANASVPDYFRYHELW